MMESLVGYGPCNKALSMRKLQKKQLEIFGYWM